MKKSPRVSLFLLSAARLQASPTEDNLILYLSAKEAECLTYCTFTAPEAEVREYQPQVTDEETGA